MAQAPLTLPVGFAGPELVLRLPTAADVDRIVDVCQDPMIQRFTRIPIPYGRSDGEGFVAMAQDRSRTGSGAHLLVEREGIVIGCVGADIDALDEVATVGYWMAAGSRRQGHTARALRTLCRWLLEDRRLARVQLQAAATNAASNAVAASVGFVHEGTRRSAMLLRPVGDLPAERVDANDWGLLAADLRGAGSPS